MPLPDSLSVEDRARAFTRQYANFERMRLVHFFSDDPLAIVWMRVDEADGGWAEIQAKRGLIREIQKDVAEMEARMQGRPAPVFPSPSPPPPFDPNVRVGFEQPAVSGVSAPPGFSPEEYEAFLRFRAMQAGQDLSAHKLVPTAPAGSRVDAESPLVGPMPGYSPPPSTRVPEPVAPRIPSSRS